MNGDQLTNSKKANYKKEKNNVYKDFPVLMTLVVWSVYLLCFGELGFYRLIFYTDHSPTKKDVKLGIEEAFGEFKVIKFLFYA